MKTVHLVSEEEAALARRMEKRLLLLPRDSGVLFASVRVSPATGAEKAIFHVFVGGSLDMDEDALHHLTQWSLARDLKPGMDVRYEVRRGVGR